MGNHHHDINVTDWRTCTSCGLKIRLLGDHRSLVYFLGESLAQRRGFQCLNCGQVTCFKCSLHGCRCTCKSNAWVALPYLEQTEWLPSEHVSTGA